MFTIPNIYPNVVYHVGQRYTLLEVSNSVKDPGQKTCGCEVISTNGNHSPVVLILLWLVRGENPRTNAENGIFFLCGKDPSLSEKNPILMSLKPGTVHELP